MFVQELANLFIVIGILVGPYLMVWLTRASLWPLVIALVYAILAVIASLFIYSASYGYGGYLMITLPFSPVILLYGWLVAKLSHWWVRRRIANAPAPDWQFGRQ